MFLASPLWMAPPAGWPEWRRRAEEAGLRLDGAAASGDPLSLVATTARAAHRPGDLYLDLDDHPGSWFKTCPHGEGQRIHGPDLLWGMPPMLVDVHTTHEQIRGFLQTVIDEGGDVGTGLVDTGHGLVMTEETTNGKVLIHRL